MEKIIFTTESAADLSPALLKERGILSVPFSVVMGEELKKDGEMSLDELFSLLPAKGILPRTSAVNEAQYDELFSHALILGEEVVHVSLSSGISSAFSNAVRAAEKFKGKVHVVDSLSLSNGLAILLYKGQELAKEGLSAEEIAAELEVMKKKVVTSFALESVDYLYKGGRCSGLACLGANLLHLRPEIAMRDGKLFPDKKFRGSRPKWCRDFLVDLLSAHPHVDKNLIFLNNALIDEDIMVGLEKELKDRGFAHVVRSIAGATICSHSGPHVLGLFFLD